jgi:transposase-like protein
VWYLPPEASFGFPTAILPDSFGGFTLFHVKLFVHPQPEATLYTDEYDSYNQLKRLRFTVCHSAGEWARDDDDDGIREVHCNSNEGDWTGLRNFLRPFRGVHKKYLSGYVAIHEFAVNQKQVSPAFVSALVRLHC